MTPRLARGDTHASGRSAAGDPAAPGLRYGYVVTGGRDAPPMTPRLARGDTHASGGSAAGDPAAPGLRSPDLHSGHASAASHRALRCTAPGRVPRK